MTFKIDHTTCEPSAHDFTYQDTGLHPDEDQQHYGRWIACNDCHAPLFYCTNSGSYHHAASNFYDDCFLADGAVVPVPEMNDNEIVDFLLISIRVAQNRGYLRTDATRLYELDENWLGDFFAIYLPKSVEGNSENEHVLAISAAAEVRGIVHPAAAS